MSNPDAPAVAPFADGITLENPVSNHFETFIVANAVLREELALAALTREAPQAVAELEAMVGTMEPPEFNLAFAARCRAHHVDGMAREDSALGQHIVICGAGPSLAEHIAEYAPQADQLWGCNSALTYLIAQGHRPTHGFCIDQTAAMLGEWVSAPDVHYLLATTVHPHLGEYLSGRGRRLTFFHNWVGIAKPPVESSDGTTTAYEDWLYAGLFPSSVRCGSGLNAVSRAIDLALFLGAARITVLGADCALRVTRPLPQETIRGSAEHMRWLREETQMHADGGHALASGATPLTFGGEIDGRHWETKPDLIITAQTLRAMADKWPDRIHLIGDTLPNALKGQAQEFLDRLPRLMDSTGATIPLI